MNLFLLERISKFALYFEAIKWNNLRIVRVILANHLQCHLYLEKCFLPSLPSLDLGASPSVLTPGLGVLFSITVSSGSVSFLEVCLLKTGLLLDFLCIRSLFLDILNLYFFIFQTHHMGAKLWYLNLYLNSYFLFILLLLLHYFFCSTFRLS